MPLPCGHMAEAAFRRDGLDDFVLQGVITNLEARHVLGGIAQCRRKGTAWRPRTDREENARFKMVFGDKLDESEVNLTDLYLSTEWNIVGLM